MLSRTLVQALLAALICCSQLASGLQVFLTELTVQSSKRIKPLEGGLQVYFQCSGEGRVELPSVTETGNTYEWPSENLLLTTLTSQSCKSCAFTEARKIPFKADSRIGDAFDLCETDFHSSKQHTVSEGTDGQFSATLYCGECLAARSPPPPSAEPPPPPDIPPQPPPADDPSSASATPARRDARVSVLFIFGIIAAVFGVLVAAIIAVLALTLLTVLVVRRLRKKSAERRAQEFEAVFSDPDLDLDDMVAEDARFFNWRLVSLPWGSVRKTQVSEDYQQP